MEEDTILVLDPAGIDGDTILWHGVEVIRHLADIVRIPADKGVVCSLRRNDIFIVIAAYVVAAQILAVWDIRDRIDQRRTMFKLLDELVAAVIFGAIQEVDIKHLTGVIQADRAIAVKISMPFTVIRRV